MALSYKEVTEILKIIDASDVEEVILELEDFRLVVRRGVRTSTDPSGTQNNFTPEPIASLREQKSTATAGETSQNFQTTLTSKNDDGVLVVRAPMVGTFFRRPSPDKEPFVEEGSKIKAGDPICLIEIMKLFTTIEAPADGTIISIVAEDGALLEFNQPMFTINLT